MGARKIVSASGEAVAKRAFWLAWQACGGPLGMGFLQDQPDATEEDVWAQARGGRDYAPVPAMISKSGEARGDYVFGRMMKLGLSFTEDSVSFRDEAPHPEYQGWCGLMFPTPLALVEAAAKELGATLTAADE